MIALQIQRSGFKQSVADMNWKFSHYLEGTSKRDTKTSVCCSPANLVVNMHCCLVATYGCALVLVAFGVQ